MVTNTLIGIGIMLTVAAILAAVAHYMGLRSDLEKAQQDYRFLERELVQMEDLYRDEKSRADDLKHYADALESTMHIWRKQDKENHAKLLEIKSQIDKIGAANCPAGDKLVHADNGVYQLFPSKDPDTNKD